MNNFFLEIPVSFQVEDYATRKQMDTNAIEKWLGPNLAYDR